VSNVKNFYIFILKNYFILKNIMKKSDTIDTKSHTHRENCANKPFFYLNSTFFCVISCSKSGTKVAQKWHKRMFFTMFFKKYKNVCLKSDKISKSGTKVAQKI